MMNLDMKNLINNIMGVSESSQKTAMNHYKSLYQMFQVVSTARVNQDAAIISNVLICIIIVEQRIKIT